MFEKKKYLIFPSIVMVITIIVAAAILLFKIGQSSANWQDYDDYGWS